MVVGEVLAAMACGDFDEGDELRTIVNAARHRGEVRTRSNCPKGSRVRIDSGDRVSQWDGVVGTVVKMNANTVTLTTGRGEVRVADHDVGVVGRRDGLARRRTLVARRHAQLRGRRGRLARGAGAEGAALDVVPPGAPGSFSGTPLTGASGSPWERASRAHRRRLKKARRALRRYRSP